MKLLFNKAVISYLLNFILWVGLGVWGNVIYKDYTEDGGKIKGWLGMDFHMTTHQISISLIVLIIIFLFMSRIFVRVDGFLYLSSKSVGFVSDDLFFYRHRKVIHLFFILIGAFMFLFTLLPSFWGRLIASIFSLIYFMAAVIALETKRNPKKLDGVKGLSEKTKFIFFFIVICLMIINLFTGLMYESTFFTMYEESWVMILILTPYIFMDGLFRLNIAWFLFDAVNFTDGINLFLPSSPLNLVEGILMAVVVYIPSLYIVTFVLVNIVFVIRDMCHKNSFTFTNMKDKAIGIKSLLPNLLFMEYRAADQSKRNAENLAILTKVYEESSGEITFEKSSLEKIILSSNGRLFLKHGDKSPEFLELKRKTDYILFLKNVKMESDNFTEFNDSEKKIIEEFAVDHRFYSRPSMEARTTNIIIRNNNNLLIGLHLFFVTCLSILFVTYVNLISDWKDIIFGLIIVGTFIRLIYRSSEICRAFYYDLIDRKLPQSFLSGKNRITLAMKSLVEIILLCATIYLSYESFKSDFTLLTFVKTVGYSLTTSLFNVSYPGSLISTGGEWKGNMYDLVLVITHIIQIVTSFVLITMSIAGYLNFPKVPMYYDSYSSNKTFRIIKKSFDNQFEKEVITVDKEIYKGTMMTEWDFYKQKVMEGYQKGEITEIEAKYAIELIEYQQDYSTQ